MAKKKFDPDEPMLKVMQRVKPFFPTEEARIAAENDPFLMEVALMDAAAIHRNRGAKNADEVKAMKKGGVKNG